MGTRSLIGMLNPDGSVSHIYCHWDGYPSNNGRILVEHYTSFDKIQQLLALGNISSLGAEIGERHDFDDRSHPDWTTAYERDRGETDTEAVKSDSVQVYKDYFKESWAEYAYLFEDGVWYVYWDGSGFFDMSPKPRPDDFVPVQAVLDHETE